MRASSIGLLAVGLSLLCQVHPLHSDPQRTSWVNYRARSSSDSFAYPGYRGQGFPERYSPSSIQSLVPVTSQTVYGIKDLQNPSGSPGYLEVTRVPETRYLHHEENRRRHRDFTSNKHEESNRDREESREEEGGMREEEVLEKMKILDKLLSEDPSSGEFEVNGIDDKIIPEESRRVARQVRKERPGFFWTLARVTFESINDTRSAIKQISDIINNSIAPDSATQSSVMRGSLTAANATSGAKNPTADNATTPTTESTASSTATPAPFVLTRSSLQSLIRRNVLGLVRLFNIEWRDAWNQSEITANEFRKDLGNQVGMFLRNNPDAY